MAPKSKPAAKKAAAKKDSLGSVAKEIARKDLSDAFEKEYEAEVAAVAAGSDEKPEEGPGEASLPDPPEQEDAPAAGGTEAAEGTEARAEAEAAPGVEADDAKPTPTPEEEAYQRRKEQTTMLQAWRRGSATGDEKIALDLYKGFGNHFSAHKSEMLAMWQKDKSCAWVREFSETRSRDLVRTSAKLEGYGTSCPLQLCPGIPWCSMVFSFSLDSVGVQLKTKTIPRLGSFRSSFITLAFNNETLKNIFG